MLRLSPPLPDNAKCFPKFLYQSKSLSVVWEFALHHILANCFYCQNFKFLSLEMCLTVVFSLNFLMANDVEHF